MKPTALIAAALRIGLGVVFLAAAIPKLADPSSFATVTANYRLLPAGLVSVVAIWLPGLELVMGIALVAGVATTAASVLATGLMGAFLVALAQARIRGIDISCGCFGGATTSTIGWIDVTRDLALFVSAVWVMLFDRGIGSAGALWARVRRRSSGPATTS